MLVMWRGVCVGGGGGVCSKCVYCVVRTGIVYAFCVDVKLVM